MLSHDLNQKILRFAPRFTAKEYAPHNFETLRSNSVSGLIVWSGASDQTIYGAPHVNHAFRAWHDSLHLKLNAPFTLDGERVVSVEQARLLGSDTLGKIVMAEVVGQVEYFEKYGRFPIDQVKFIQDYLKGRI